MVTPPFPTGALKQLLEQMPQMVQMAYFNDEGTAHKLRDRLELVAEVRVTLARVMLSRFTC